MLACLVDEVLRVALVVLVQQQFDGLLVVEFIEPQHRNPRIGRHGLKAPAVAVSQPVSLAARDAKAGRPETIEPVTDVAQRDPEVLFACSHLVETIDEQDPVAPPWTRVEVQLDEIPGTEHHRGVTEFCALAVELSRLARPRVAEKHNGGPRAKLRQRPAAATEHADAADTVAVNLGAGAAYRRGHDVSIQ